MQGAGLEDPVDLAFAARSGRVVDRDFFLPRGFVCNPCFRMCRSALYRAKQVVAAKRCFQISEAASFKALNNDLPAGDISAFRWYDTPTGPDPKGTLHSNAHKFPFRMS